jgi:putative DNA primase/helicase
MRYDIANIPAELHHLKQWVCWKAVKNEKGKITKIPINPNNGKNAMSNNPDTWTDMMGAVVGYNKFNLDGIGFMLENGYFGIDLDDCDTDLKNEFIDHMQSYTEVSQSGNGIHIICKGNLPKGKRRTKGIEMYDTNRFFVMTGNKIGNYHIVDGTEKIKQLHDKYLTDKKIETVESVIVTDQRVNLNDNDVLLKAQNSKNGLQFKLLFDGQWETLNYPSQSEADLSLSNLLAFWTGKDFEQMDRLFRMSGLYRDKWDRRQSGTTYGAITLQTAITNCKSIYSSNHDDESILHINVKTGEVSYGQTVNYELNDSGNAQRMIDRYAGYIMYNYENKMWRIWNGKFWQNDVTRQVKNYAEVIINEMKVQAFQSEDEYDRKQRMKNVQKAYSSNGKEAMLKEAQHLEGVPCVNNDFDNQDFMLNVDNGVVDLISGKLLDHDKKYMMSKMSSVAYDDSSKPTQWLKFLDQVFLGDQELIKFIQKAVGYTLTGSIREQALFILYGDGSNGKTVFLDIISRLLGEYAVNTQVETILERKNGSNYTSDLARLKGARFVTTGENNEGSKLNEGLVKQLTGGEQITARFLYGVEFEFYPNFKLWLATNHKPIIRGTDTGIWRRIMAIPFRLKVAEKDRDKNLVFKLEQELPQILAWAVEGCLLWQKEQLEPPTAIRESTQEYKNEMDIISTFIEDCCSVEDWETNANDLYSEYEQWAKSSNEFVMSKTKFGRELAKKFEKERKSYGVVYKGVRLLKDSPAYIYKKYDV